MPYLTKSWCEYDRRIFLQQIACLSRENGSDTLSSQSEAADSERADQSAASVATRILGFVNAPDTTAESSKGMFERENRYFLLRQKQRGACIAGLKELGFECIRAGRRVLSLCQIAGCQMKRRSARRRRSITYCSCREARSRCPGYVRLGVLRGLRDNRRKRAAESLKSWPAEYR